jgi:hypothetical protein
MSRDPSDEWFLRSRGKVLGPFGFRQLKVMRNQGRLAKFDEVSQGDRKSWVVAKDLRELFPSEAQTDPEPNPVEPAYDLGDAPKGEAPTWYYMGTGVQGASEPQTLSDMVRLVGTGVIISETLVWTADLVDWVPARTVPALGLSQPATPAGAAKTESPSTTVALKPQGTGFSVAGFILGLLGLCFGLLLLVVSFVTSGARRNHDVAGFILLGILVAWAVLAIFAVTFGSIGMSRASRQEKRRGFGLGLTGLILGILSMMALLVLVVIVAMGVIVWGPGA